MTFIVLFLINCTFARSNAQCELRVVTDNILVISSYSFHLGKTTKTPSKFVNLELQRFGCVDITVPSPDLHYIVLNNNTLITVLLQV